MSDRSSRSETLSVEEREREIRRLYRERPRSRFLRASAAAVLLLVAGSWWLGDFAAADLFSERRLANLERFLGELRPFPLQQERDPGTEGGFAPDLVVAARWAAELFEERGFAAAKTTLALSVAAIVLAALGALVLAPAAARTLSTPEPFLPGPRPPGRPSRIFWRGLVALSRGVLILLRSIPEYVLAFLFLAILGPTAWPLVLALAVHNSGILGKLVAEVIENLDDSALAAWRGQGAGRLQILLFAVLPLVLPRFLLFFFYRWETCVREATVLGMLGVVSLGYWIVDARARNHYDVMLFMVLVGAVLVMIGDLVSALTRGVVRRAS